VLLGIATAGFLEDRLPKERMVSLGFLVGGIVLVGGSFALDGPVILLVAGILGLTFAWKKVSVDTMTQESLPDGYRGRVFSVYDFFYNVARLIAAALAIVMIPAMSSSATMVVVGAVFLAWTPVLPAIVSHRPQIDLRLNAAGVPVALQWGATNEPVVVLATNELGYRLELEDGSVIDVRRAQRRPGWTVLREREG